MGGENTVDQANTALPAAEQAKRSPLRTFFLRVLAALRFKKARAALLELDTATEETTEPTAAPIEENLEAAPQPDNTAHESANAQTPQSVARGALLERVDAAVKKKQSAQRKAVPLPRLLAAMQHQDEKVRVSAIKRLAYMEDDQAVEALLNALADENHLVGRAALQALKFIGQRAIPGLLSLLNSSNVNSRGAAIEALGEIGDQVAVPALLQCLSDTTKPWLADLRICDIAAEALTAIGSPEAAAAVEAWHQTMHEKAAMNGNGAVAHTDQTAPPANDGPPPIHRDILSELLNDLQHEDWQTRQRAAKNLRDYAKEMHGIKDPRVLGKLWRSIASDDWVIRWASAEALAWIGDPESIPKIMPLLDDPNWTVRIAGIRALLEIGDSSTVDAVTKKLDDANNNVREAAAEALGVLGNATIIPRLEYALLDDEAFVRLSVVNALGNIGGAEVIPPLVRALSDNDANVRWAAAGALIEHHDENTVPALLEHLEDTGGPYWEGERICDRVAEALEKIGTPEALAAVQAWQAGDND